MGTLSSGPVSLSFLLSRGSQEPQAQPRPEDAPAQQSYYPHSVNSRSSSRPLTPS